MVSGITESNSVDMEDPLYLEDFLANIQASLEAHSQYFQHSSTTPNNNVNGTFATVPDINTLPSPSELELHEDLHLDCGNDLDSKTLDDIEYIIHKYTDNQAPESPCSITSSSSESSEELCAFSDVDPMSWDKATVRNWVKQKAQEYGIQNVPLDRFDMTGSDLCSLTLKEFCNLCEYGDLLFLGLEMQLGYQNQGGVSMYDLIQAGSFPVSEPLFTEVPSNSPEAVQDVVFYDDTVPESPQSSTDSPSETHSLHDLSDDDDWVPPNNKSPGPKPSRSPNTTSKRSEKPKKVIHSRRGRPRSDGRIPSPNRGNRSVHLYEFLRDLLEDKEYCPRYITWTSRERGIFRLVNSGAVAKLWGKRKNRANMNYEKMSRALRYYYDRNILERVGQRLVYKFSDEASKVLEQKYTTQ